MSMVMYKARSQTLEFPEENGCTSFEQHYIGVKQSLGTLPSFQRNEYIEERKNNDVLINSEVNDRRYT